MPDKPRDRKPKWGLNGSWCTACGREVGPGVNYAYMHWLLCPFTNMTGIFKLEEVGDATP